jgi:putative phage-type endonuclease
MQCVQVDVENLDGTISRGVWVTPHVKRIMDLDRQQAVVQRSMEWYERRKKFITASQVASIIGVCHFDTRVTMMRKKLRLTDESESFASKAMKYGTENEPIAIRKYEEITGKKVIPIGLLESVNENEPFFAGSPDGIRNDGILIEVKCPYSRIPTDEVPSWYVPQVQFLMHILQLDECHFVQYRPQQCFDDEMLIITSIKRDPEWIVRVRPMLESFWADLLRLRGMPVERLMLDNDHPELDDAIRLPRRKKKEPIEVNGEIMSIIEDETKKRKKKEKEEPAGPSISDAELWEMERRMREELEDFKTQFFSKLFAED